MNTPPLGQADEEEGLEVKGGQGVGASQRGGCIRHSASCVHWSSLCEEGAPEEERWLVASRHMEEASLVRGNKSYLTNSYWC